jgi:hypothetical protein
MLLWEYVLTGDLREDLTVHEHALRWLGRERFVLPQVELNGQRSPMRNYWGTFHGRFFAGRVQALRSIAFRLKGFKSRSPRLEDWTADRLFNVYLGQLQLAPRRKRSKRGTLPEPLDKKNYAGLQIGPVLPTRESMAGTIAEEKLDEQQVQGLIDLQKFWIDVFGSLILPDIAPVCGACGKPLDPTPTGRRSRAKFCKACAFNEWEKTQSVKKKRKRWREAKAQQRADEMSAN